MAKKDKKPLVDDTAETAWKLFEKSGNISYYLLYKRIRGDNSGNIF